MSTPERIFFFFLQNLFLVDNSEIHDKISSSQDQNSNKHIEQAVFDAFDLCGIIWFHQEFHRLDDDDYQDDQ